MARHTYYEDPDEPLNDLCISCVNRPKTSADGMCDECFAYEEGLKKYDRTPWLSICVLAFVVVIALMGMPIFDK